MSKEACVLVPMVLEREITYLSCATHNPENYSFRYLSEYAVRCPQGPRPSDDMILALFKVGEPTLVYDLVKRIYPVEIYASPSSKGAHMGASFKAAALKKRLVEMQGRGLVKYIDGEWAFSRYSILMGKWVKVKA